MNKYSFIFLTVITFSCKNEPSEDFENNIHIVPKPMYMEQHKGSFSINGHTAIVSQGKGQDKIASFFIDKIKSSTGFHIEMTKGKLKRNAIIFQLDNTLDFKDEGYFLKVTSTNITIRAKKLQGLFYGMQTIMQLLPPEIESKTPISNVKWNIPNVEIRDEPAFGWRGVNLDVGRHFVSVDFIKKQLDILALFKMNKFHWHLTEDQGWRIEVKKYPKLTEIGAKRKNDDGTIYQGHYTQEQIKEVVAYAQERFIDVIPEIDVPGHVVSALASYPELSCTGEHLETRVLSGIDSNILCAGREHTFTFLEAIFQEIVPLFPYEYFHIGGDEAPKDNWKACLHCQKRIADEHLEDEDHLQSYFMARVEKILKKHNKKVFGWDEILEGNNLSPTANITSWRGEEGGIIAANAGHDVVMNPMDYTYLNFYQGDHKVEPMAFGGYTPLEKIYNYHPIPSKISVDKRKHILGAQASLWTENAPDGPTIEYQLYPRIIALAELTWTPTKMKDYEGFLERLSGQYIRLDNHGINYHIPLPEGPSSNQVVFIKDVSLGFRTTHPVKMVYSLDGKNPTSESPVYKDSLVFDKNTSLKIASLLPHGKMSAIREIQIEKQEIKNALRHFNGQPGLSVKTIKGHFGNLKEIDFDKNPIASKIDSLEQANKTYDWGHYVDENSFRALVIEGDIDIPEDGVYIFSSNQDQVWIADELVIDYKAIIKKHPKDGSIALASGKHKLKIIYLNNITKGWASDWNTVELRYRKFSEKELKSVGQEMLSH